MVCRPQLSEVLLDKGLRYTPVQQGLDRLGLSMHTFRVNGAASISYSSHLNRL